MNQNIRDFGIGHMMFNGSQSKCLVQDFVYQPFLGIGCEKNTLFLNEQFRGVSDLLAEHATIERG